MEIWFCRFGLQMSSRTHIFFQVNFNKFLSYCKRERRHSKYNPNTYYWRQYIPIKEIIF